HHHELAIVLFADLVGLHDVRVGQARGEARLVEEHLYERGVVGVLRELDDRELLKPSHAVHAGEEDIGHTAMTELSQEPVPAEKCCVCHQTSEDHPCGLIRRVAPKNRTRNVLYRRTCTLQGARRSFLPHRAGPERLAAPKDTLSHSEGPMRYHSIII